MRKPVYLLPNIITAFGLCCGLFAIFKVNMTTPGDGNIEMLRLSTTMLLIAAFADLLDGAIARVIKAESSFGGQFDAMADAITFGVAPSLIVLKTLSIPSGTEFAYLMTTAAMIYSLCGVLRLVRFTVTNNQASNDLALKQASMKHFTGLPIPAAAAAILSGNLFLISDEFRSLISMTSETHAWILFCMMLVIGYFMISRWKFLSFKTLNIRVMKFQQVFLTATFAVFVVFYGLMQHFSVTFFLISWLYVVTAWILSIIRLISGKKSKTLVEFEPEPEEFEPEETEESNKS